MLPFNVGTWNQHFLIYLIFLFCTFFLILEKKASFAGNLPFIK